MTEEWRDIPGYEGVYQASSLGRVKSLERMARGKPPGHRPIRERVLSQLKRPTGYLFVRLSKDGKAKALSVHRVVCYAFLGEPPYGFQVNHINGEKSDNRISNLEYVSPSCNVTHARRVLEVGGYAKRKLSASDVTAIRALYSRGESQSHVASKFGVSLAHVNNIIHRKVWKHVE